jgi:hypothetical protein
MALLGKLAIGIDVEALVPSSTIIESEAPGVLFRPNIGSRSRAQELGRDE